ncbi:hypothetical protein PLICRDRAFT_33579 [Plicaturopsis crispa FD-325 SS-3]|nr:hypothetical protein PLICRDRAFT_33579 [Plicaturopsis crispa FD-325 SS-3]
MYTSAKVLSCAAPFSAPFPSLLSSIYGGPSPGSAVSVEHGYPMTAPLEMSCTRRCNEPWIPSIDKASPWNLRLASTMCGPSWSPRMYSALHDTIFPPVESGSRKSLERLQVAVKFLGIRHIHTWAFSASSEPLRVFCLLWWVCLSQHLDGTSLWVPRCCNGNKAAAASVHRAAH